MSLVRRKWTGKVHVLDGVRQVECESIAVALEKPPQTPHAVITVGGHVVAEVFGRGWRLVSQPCGAFA